MGEYIITDEQIAENRRLHGKKLLVMPIIVRCRDCGLKDYCIFVYAGGYDPNGFCAWGERLRGELA